MIKTLQRVTVIVGLLVATACSGDVAGTAAQIPADPFWSAELNTHRVVMSVAEPYNTLQLQVTPRRASGALLVSGFRTTFISGDSTLSVTADGRVTALETTSRSFVAVIVEEEATRFQRVDTVFITTTDITAPRRLASLVLQRTIGDTVKLPIDSARRLTFVATDSAGRRFTTSQLPVRFQTRNSAVAGVVPETGDVSPAAPTRSTTITASITYYGITLRDSIQLYVGYPMLISYSRVIADGVASAPTLFGSNVLTIAVGGTLVFQPSFSIQSVGSDGWPLVLASHPYEVVFDDPDVAEESDLTSFSGVPVARERGNIAALSLPVGPYMETYMACVQGLIRCLAARSFRTPGTFTFRDPYSGDTGRIVVK